MQLPHASRCRQPLDWPSSAPQFSVILNIEGHVNEDWRPATARALIEDAPHSELLETVSELLILEGPRVVAKMKFFPQSE
jgi:hypothetical protein